MPCTSILQAWVISLSLHALFLGGATWLLTEIHAPTPEQVFRWDIALESGSTSGGREASAGLTAEPTRKLSQPPRRIMQATTHQVHRPSPKVVARAVTTHVRQNSPTMRSTQSFLPAVSRRSPPRIVTEQPLTAGSTPRPATRYVQVVRPMTVEKVSTQSPPDSVVTKAASQPVEKAARRKQRGAGAPEVITRSHAVMERKIVSDRVTAEYRRAPTSDASQAYRRATDAAVPTVTMRPPPHISTHHSASVVRQSSPDVKDELTTVVPSANGLTTQVQVANRMRQESAMVAASPELETKVVTPLGTALVKSLAEASVIEDGASNGALQKRLSVETGTFVARAAPGTNNDFGWLAKSMHTRIANLKRYPYRARINHWEGKVVLRAVIADDGRLADVSVKRSSGYKILDREALELVRRVCPVPLKYPLGRSQVVMHIPITYKLER